MDSTLRRVERLYVKLSLGSLAAFILFVGCCWGGYRIYARWQEHHYLRQAHEAFDRSDLRWAALAAQRAYSWRSDSLDACRLLAEVADRQLDDKAIDWRRRAIEIRPDSVPNAVALAETALRLARPQIAAEALARVPPAKQNVPYQSAAGRLALAKGDLAGARQHLAEAARLAQNDLPRQLELAEFELRSDDHAQREHGRALALRLKSNPQVQIVALEVLINDALRWGDAGMGVTLAKELDAIPKAPFSARIQALSALRVFNDPSFAGALSRLQTEGADSVKKAVSLINWMNSHGLALLAINWSKQLSPPVLNALAMRTALADSYLAMRDWGALAAMLKSGSWASAEPLRLALQARAAHETGDETGFEKDWTAAVGKAGSDPDRLGVLQKLASEWHWRDKAAAILWVLADNRRTQRDALQALYQYYRETRDTTGLYRCLLRLAGIMPDDLAVRNNLTQLSLLLDAEPAKARATARQLYEAHPLNPAFASTYAFALYKNGDAASAVKVMQKLSHEQLKDPSIAAYYGVILAKSETKQDAKQYLELGGKTKLLPEEENLVAQAKTELAQQ